MHLPSFCCCSHRRPSHSCFFIIFLLCFLSFTFRCGALFSLLFLFQYKIYPPLLFYTKKYILLLFLLCVCGLCFTLYSPIHCFRVTPFFFFLIPFSFFYALLFPFVLVLPSTWKPLSKSSTKEKKKISRKKSEGP